MERKHSFSASPLALKSTQFNEELVLLSHIMDNLHNIKEAVFSIEGTHGRVL